MASREHDYWRLTFLLTEAEPEGYDGSDWQIVEYDVTVGHRRTAHCL